jgi:hypothetical protein
MRESMSLPILYNPPEHSGGFFFTINESSQGFSYLYFQLSPAMHKVSILLLICTLQYLVNPVNSYSSPADSSKIKLKRDSTQVSFFYNDFEKLGSLKLHPCDTSLTGFQNYFALAKQSNFFATLGNNGQNYRNLIPYPVFQSSGFDFGIHSFDQFLYQNDSVKYYKILKTYTDLKYVQGAKKEIFFQATFSRNVYRSLNIGFDLKVSNSPGTYLRQSTNQINFVLTTQYFTKDKRYGVIGNFLINRLKNNENGGIKNDSVFEQNLEANRQVIDIRLSKAQTRIRESGFFMKHYFNLSRHPKNPKDSIFYSSKHLELGRLSYSFEYNRQIQNYLDNDPKSGFYSNIFLDSIATLDSVTINRFVNEVCWTNPSFRSDRSNRLLQLEIHLKQQYLEVRDHAIRNFFIQYIPSVDLSINLFSTLHLEANGDYVLGDYNEGDKSLKVALSQTLGSPKKNGGTIILKGHYAIQKPGWFYEHYSGNNFRWDTAWQKQNLISGCFSYVLKNLLETGVSISRINHFVYLDSTASPRQENQQFGYLYAYLNGTLNLWRLKFKGQFAYQTVQGANVLRIPAFLGNLTFYYTQQLFHGAAAIQPGLNFNYNTLYYADSYMPATRSFFIQNSKQVGNYLYMDVFINLKIQRARIFVMYSHFNSSFMGNSYFTVPHYPMQDAAFKFGLSWKFFD